MSAKISRNPGGCDSVRCVHCRSNLPLDGKTKDHVFPKSWFPASTPDIVQRWTVPSCVTCNRKLGAMEKELFVRMAMCPDPRKREAAGLSKKALRSMGMGVSGLTGREKLHRDALKRKILSDIQPHQADDVTMPGFGTHSGFADVQQFRITVPANLVFEVGKKILRGCEYILGNGRIVDPPYDVHFYMADEPKIQGVVAMFAPFGPVDLGPGFEVRRATAREDPLSSIFQVSIWDTWKFYGVIVQPE